jgi:deoxyadenosine/deoxycytidine kinase
MTPQEFLGAVLPSSGRFCIVGVDKARERYKVVHKYSTTVEDAAADAKDLLQQKDLFQQITISDYLFTKCLLFAKVNLPEDEFRLYQRLFDILQQQVIMPELLIYLHAPVNKLQENIRKRNRSYEQKIPDDYLFNIQQTYTHYIRQHNIKTIFVDAGNADFLGNPKQLHTIIDALEKDYDHGQHFLALP